MASTFSTRNAAPHFLVLWCCFLFIYGLNAGELWRNEGLRVRIAQEMLADGDWVVPHLYGQPIFTKPPFMYWAICLVSWPFGAVTTVSARLPSVLAAFGTVCLFWWTFRRCLGTRGGYLAALFAPLTVFWLEKTPSAEIDALQVFWVAGSILFFLRALEGGVEATGLRSWNGTSSVLRGDGGFAWWMLAGLCLAGGTLTKWTAPVFFYGTALPLLWWRGELKVLLGWRHVSMMLLSLCLVGGWIGAVILRTGGEEFWNAIVIEAAPRLLPSAHPRPYPWLETLLHPLVVLAAALPLSLGLLTRRPLDLLEGEEKLNGLNGHRAELLFQALHCWLWPNLLFWTLHPDHTLRNRAPLLPAIAGVAVFAWLAWERKAALKPRRFRRPAYWLAGLLIVWAGLKTVHVVRVLPERAEQRQTRQKAADIAAWLPADVLLYLFRIKDECLFFYLNHGAERLSGPDNLPNTHEAVFCILTEDEWRTWSSCRPARLVTQLEDGQGDAIYLVQVMRGAGS